MVIQISDLDEYNLIVNTNDKVVVDFSAQWCGPCKRIAPLFKKLSEQYADIVFIKVDVDDAPEIAAEENISAMPTFHAYHNGNRVKTLTGASEEKVASMIKDLHTL